MSKRGIRGPIMRVRKVTNTVVEYIGGIEVINAFNQSADSYQKYSESVEDNASCAVNWMKSVQMIFYPIDKSGGKEVY